MRRIKLGIIDDSIFCRNLTKLQLLNFNKVRFDFVLEAESIADFQTKAEKTAVPEVILLDVMMPGIDGVSGIPIIKQKFPNTHIIMLSDITNPAIIRNSILSGAYAFVNKGTKTCELVDIINDVLTGSCYACPELTKSLFFGIQKPPQDRRKLSERELHIVHLMLEGLSLQKIAMSYKISIERLWVLINRIIVKLNINYKHPFIG